MCRRVQGKYGGVLQRGNYDCNTFTLSYIHLQPLDLVRLRGEDKQPPKDLLCAVVFCFVRVVICSSLSPAETANLMKLYCSIWIYWSVQKTAFLSVLVAEYLAVCACVVCVSIHPSIHPLAVRNSRLLSSSSQLQDIHIDFLSLVSSLTWCQKFTTQVLCVNCISVLHV